MAEETAVTIIRPYIGAGPVAFGMTLDEVEAVLGPPFVRQYTFGDAVSSGARRRPSGLQIGAAAQDLEVLDTETTLW